jgi:hypothetical protein
MDSSFESMNLPDSLDWRTKGVISKIQNQGQTGQVEAIVSVGEWFIKKSVVRLRSFETNISEIIESLHAIQTGNLEAGSVARVIDCCPSQINTLQCISKLGGICHEGDYPTTTGQCVPNKCTPFAKVCTLIHS